jgi:alpha-glucosidase
MVWQSSAPLGGFSTAPKAWLPVPFDHLSRAADLQIKANDSVLQHYRATLAFRKQHPALQKGSIKTHDAPEGVLAFTRATAGETLFCAFNMTDKSIIYALPPGIEPRASGAPGIVSGPVGGSLSLGPFAAYIGVLAGT